MKRGFGSVQSERREETPVSSIDFKTEPVLAVFIVEVDVAPSEICDPDGSHDWLVRDILQPLELQFHLDLRLRRRGQKKEQDQLNEKFHRAAKITHLGGEERMVWRNHLVCSSRSSKRELRLNGPNDP